MRSQHASCSSAWRSFMSLCLGLLLGCFPSVALQSAGHYDVHGPVHKRNRRLHLVVSPGLTLSHMPPKKYRSSVGYCFSAGLLYDWLYRPNYGLTGGLLWTSRRVQWRGPTTDNVVLTHLHVPVLVQGCTGDVWLDTRLSFCTGLVFGLKLDETSSKIDSNKSYFNQFELAFALGGGVLYDFSANTAMTLSLNYWIDLRNLLHEHPHEKRLKMRTHLLRLQMGFCFW